MGIPLVTTLSGDTVSVDLGTRDFEGFRDDALELATVVAPDWTDRSEVDVGVTLVESEAFMLDNLAYYQDRCANEALWPSATQRRSVIEQGKLINYALSPNVSASVDLTVTVTGAGVLPAGTQVAVDTTDGSDPMTFELEAAFTAVGPGVTTGVVALHGTTVSETLGSSTGGVGQTFSLRSTPLTTNPGGTSSLQVYVSAGGPGILWTEVDAFLASEPTDEHYRIEIDEDDLVTVIFPDGVNGKVPPAGTNNVTATYRIGGGRNGNRVAAGKLTKLLGFFPFVTSVTNPLQPSGGRDKESIEEAKVNGPASLVALDRGVRHDDYTALAKEVSGVDQAFSYRGDGAYEEHVVVAASGTNPIPSGSWDPYTLGAAGLLGAVGTYLSSRKTTPVILWVDPCVVYDLHISIEVYLFANTRRTDATRAIEDAIAGAFDVEAALLGDQIALSDLNGVVELIPGVDYLNVTRFQREPYARSRTSWSTTDITFSMVVGETTLRERWTIQFASPTIFTVSGRTVGPQSTSGTVGAAFTTDDGGFEFTIVAGTIPPASGEVWEILTGPYVGNMDPDRDELCRLFGGTFGLVLVGGRS